MRVLHTSDWHLGRSFHGASVTRQQEAALDAIVELTASEGVDVVVIAGDLYDRALPPVEAVELFSTTLHRLRRAGAQVVAIAGNHDSAPRVGFARDILADAGVHLWGDVGMAGQAVVIPATDGGPPLAVYPIPYLEPETARHQLDVPDARSHQAVLHTALDRARADLAARGPIRSLVTAHAFVAGGTPCDSERVLRIGGADRVGIPTFAGFDYAALGHLHARQVLAHGRGDGRVRYSGSPIAYSFSEANHVKGVWLIDLAKPSAKPSAKSSGTIDVRGVDLPAGRGLAALTGTLEELLHSRAHTAAETKWVQATLTDQLLPRDAMATLRRRFPHAVSMMHEPPITPGGAGSYRHRMRDRDDATLVAEFISHVTGQDPSPVEHQDCVTAIDDCLGSLRAAG